MKKALLVLLFLASLTSFAQEVTTYYLVRHAEKDRTDKTNSNPELTQKGMQRAVQWSQAFEYVDFRCGIFYQLQKNGVNCETNSCCKRFRSTILQPKGTILC